MPKLVFPGGCIIGCSAGLLNVAKLKGTHNAIMSGLLAADAIFQQIDPAQENQSFFFFFNLVCFFFNLVIIPTEYEKLLNDSFVMKELKSVRNIRPSFNTSFGYIGGMIYTALFYMIGRGKEPWTLHHGKKDNEKTEPKNLHKPINYQKPDGKLTFDLLTSVALSGTNHEENQPSHLTLLNDDVPETINLQVFDGLEQRFCPAGILLFYFFQII